MKPGHESTSRRSAIRAIVAALAVGLAATACGEAGDDAATAGPSPAAISDHECAVCGMLVRDQPAPRAQLVHRDGTEAFTCSIGDLLVYLAAPSPHGSAKQVWVEVIEPEEPPEAHATHTHRWVDASDAWYVVGVERRGVMGPPVLAYAEKAQAESRARQHAGAHVLDRDGLDAWWKATHR